MRSGRPDRRYGCNVRDVYDVHYPEYVREEEFCLKWSRDYHSKYFTKVFDNGDFKVLRVETSPQP
eukprot:m.87625 g.87625  ORF g.87625 m.87625 type:complete len:65 (-) comp8329_c0_seq1:1500-1694(-)